MNNISSNILTVFFTDQNLKYYVKRMASNTNALIKIGQQKSAIENWKGIFTVKKWYLELLNVRTKQLYL